MKSPFDLPDLAVVFDELRKGRHICVEDGDLYRSLLMEYESFRELFHYLGFTLVRHPRDFFYFRSDLGFTTVARRMAVFMFILIEHLANEGRSVEEALTSGYIAIDTLPHETSKRFRRYMDEAGITVEKSINTLTRHGFAEYSGGSKFRFRSPVYRFIDLCLTVMSAGDPGDEVDDTELVSALGQEEDMDD
ncbi:MAG: hypothetical protein RBR67_20225 [Desulfobacterium sp.]|nr:hypothetical protein [Desulfobacterium sp.]